MRAVLQRVSSSRVTVEQECVGSIGQRLMNLLGIAEADQRKDVIWLAEKVANLRIFEDERGKMNLSLLDIQGEALVVSQFTLLADCRKGRRPSFVQAASPELAKQLYKEFVAELRGHGLNVATGTFQAQMQVDIVNEGPVTMLLDSNKRF